MRRGHRFRTFSPLTLHECEVLLQLGWDLTSHFFPTKKSWVETKKDQNWYPICVLPILIRWSLAHYCFFFLIGIDRNLRFGNVTVSSFNFCCWNVDIERWNSCFQNIFIYNRLPQQTVCPFTCLVVSFVSVYICLINSIP